MMTWESLHHGNKFYLTAVQRELTLSNCGTKGTNSDCYPNVFDSYYNSTNFVWLTPREPTPLDCYQKGTNSFAYTRGTNSLWL